MFRLTGRVVKVSEKSGSKADTKTGEVRLWAMDIYTVLVAEQAIVEVVRFAGSAIPAPAVGANIDWAVEVSPRAGNRLSVSVVDEWAGVGVPIFGESVHAGKS